MDIKNNFNLALLTDLYQLTMMQGYFYYKKDDKAVFDYFYRRQPFSGGYSIFAGLETLTDFITKFKFSDDDIEFLSTLKIFKNDFLGYLKNFKFNIDLYSLAEGDLIFPNEPLIRAHGSLVELQLLETVLLNIINFQTLIATKTARIVEAASGKNILEFGLRRAQGFNGALSATRASFIGGASGTSNVLAGKLFGIPVQGTMAHSWVMAFETEEEAFKKYAELYPETTLILVDTFNTIKNGLPGAIKVLKELKEKKIKNFGIRLDSGDLEYLSKTARSMLDEAGLYAAKIIVSNELDENVIEELVNKKSPIDVFGVGTNLVTGKDDPALTGVYKLCAKSKDNKFTPCIKISDDPKKTTNPDIKNILRFYKKNEMLADLIILENEKDIILEKIKFKKPIDFRHPDYINKFFILNEYDEVKILLNKIIEKGKLISPNPRIDEIKNNTKINLKKLNSTYKRLLNPHIYKVSISEKLMQLKLNMINKFNPDISEVK